MLLSLHSSCYVTTVKSWTDMSLILKRGKLHWVVCKNISGTQAKRHITQASIRIECRASCPPQNHHLVCESHRLIYAQYPGYVTRQEFTVMISGSDATGRKPGLLTLVSLQTLLMVSNQSLLVLKEPSCFIPKHHCSSSSGYHSSTGCQYHLCSHV